MVLAHEAKIVNAQYHGQEERTGRDICPESSPNATKKPNLKDDSRDDSGTLAVIPNETLLSLDMGTKDCFYRIRRDFQTASTVAYVHLQDLDILAEDRQTYGPSVIRDLRSIIDVWTQPWTTLTVFRKNGKIQSIQDGWKPHFLYPEVRLTNLPRLNVLDLEVLHSFKNRVSLVSLDSRRRILKICPFRFELPYFSCEIKAYSILSARGCRLIPSLLAYVYERSEEQILGFVCEELQGRFAEPSDYDVCKDALRTIHTYGFIHGDLNRFNIIVTTDGPKFIDFEKSTLNTDNIIPDTEFVRLQQEELDKLEKALLDNEGWGRPWPETDSERQSE
jgi:RIO1 family